MSGKEKKYLSIKVKLIATNAKVKTKDEALCVKIGNINISQVTNFSIDEAQKWFFNLDNILIEKEKKIAQHI